MKHTSSRIVPYMIHLRIKIAPSVLMLTSGPILLSFPSSYSLKGIMRISDIGLTELACEEVSIK